MVSTRKWETQPSEGAVGSQQLPMISLCSNCSSRQQVAQWFCGTDCPIQRSQVQIQTASELFSTIFFHQFTFKLPNILIYSQFHRFNFFLLSSMSNPKVSSVSTSCNPRGFEIGARLEVIELLAPISNDSIRSWFGNLDLERWGGGRRRGRMGGGRGWFNYWAQRKCSFEMNFLKFACLFDLLLFLCFVFIHFFVFCFFFGFFVLFFTFLLWARNPHDTSGTVASGFH